MRFAWLIRLIFIPLCVSGASARADCVGLVTASAHHQFWHDLSTGAQRAADELGLKLLFRAPREEGETPLQLRLILSLKDFGCDAFVIAPNDVSINEVVASLHADNIPTVYVDRNTTAESAIVSLVMTDNYAAGRQAAAEVARRVPKEARVALFGLKKGVTSTDDRERGFADYMREIGRPIVAHRYIGTGRDEAVWHSTDFFMRQNDPRIDAVFTPNESSTEAVIETLDALEADGKITSRPIHIGFDMSPQIQEAIDQGSLAGVINQDPRAMGYQGVMIAHRARTGQPVEPVVNTPFIFVTADTLN